MARVGGAYDNALCETFFAVLECELLDGQRFRTQGKARLAVFDFSEGRYNPRRRPSVTSHRGADASDGGIARLTVDRAGVDAAESWLRILRVFCH